MSFAFISQITTSRLNQNQVAATLSRITLRVSNDMNDQLDKPFLAEEVVKALSQMCPIKAPGPNGLPTVFYQKHWQTIKSKVITTCLYILNKQGTIGPLNHTYITLIFKIGKSRKVIDFRPISLCNVIYKIVVKTITNRLKQILSKVISPMQSAFIPNRLITDNIIVGYECLHKIRQSRGKRNGLLALKLDINKAYDKLELNFLEQTMLKLGFSQNYVRLVMRCISSAFFFVIINGTISRLIKPQRGLRQGCLLSPYHFIICAEAFSSLLVQAEQQKLIHGLSFGNDIKIAHLLFMDDSLIFTRASTTYCQNLKRIFYCYCHYQTQI